MLLRWVASHHSCSWNCIENERFYGLPASSRKHRSMLCDEIGCVAVHYYMVENSRMINCKLLLYGVDFQDVSNISSIISIAKAICKRHEASLLYVVREFIL